MLSRRVPTELEPNAWAARLADLRAAGASLVDLTEVNPTRVGLGGLEPAQAEALAHAAARSSYDPDPRGLPSARAAIAAYYRDRSLAVDPAHLVLTAGTSEAYAHLFRLLADPGDCVLAPAPSYPLFEPIAALESLRVRTYPLIWDGRWHVDRAAFDRGLAEGARAAIVVQPNHPTGSCLDREEIAALEDSCARHDAALISDEVFGDFAWERRSAGLPSLVGERRALTFVLSGLSKVCGLPQLKLGWIWTGGPAPARDAALGGLEWIADLFLSVATPVQEALAPLLQARHAFQALALARIAVNRARLAEAARRRPELTRLESDGGWVAVVRLPGRRDEERWVLDLLGRGVVVHPGHFYDLEREPFLVVSLIVEPAVFDAGMSGLESLLAEG